MVEEFVTFGTILKLPCSSRVNILEGRLFMFKKDDAVVHPAHGVGIICEISRETISGREKNYYKIEFPLNEIDTVMVPVDNAENVGLRAVVSEEIIQEILFILTDTEGEYLSFIEDESFHKRHKEYVDRVQCGDIIEVVKVFKALRDRARLKDLGLKEKFLMERAEKMLLGEIAFARKIPLDNAKEILISGRF